MLSKSSANVGQMRYPQEQQPPDVTTDNGWLQWERVLSSRHNVCDTSHVTGEVLTPVPAGMSTRSQPGWQAGWAA